MLKDIPVYASFRRIEKLHAGSTLVMAGDNSSADSAPILVCKVTAEEESQGYRYDRSVPFVINEKKHLHVPPDRGTWFEVAGTGFALRAWANANVVTSLLGG